MKKLEIHNLINPPGRLVKYYKYDSKLNKKRLKGEVYLSSPLDFNDPCDCRALPENNVHDFDAKGHLWVVGKIREFGFSKAESEKLAKDLEDNGACLRKLHHQQLEKLGILCLTSSHKDAQMWGYYADNDGFCLEYDTEKLVQRLLIGVVDTMEYGLTKLLYEDKYYCMGFVERRRTLNPPYGIIGGQMDIASDLEMEKFAVDLIPDNSVPIEKVNNDYLRELLETNKEINGVRASQGVHNFMRHVFVKRFAGEMIKYVDGDNIMYPTLFFNHHRPESKGKYFQKTRVWRHEKEFRIVVSLAGRKVIKLQPDIVKNVYLGCDVPPEKVAEFAYLITSMGLKCSLYKMARTSRGFLTQRAVNLDSLKSSLKKIQTRIDKVCGDRHPAMRSEGK